MGNCSLCSTQTTLSASRRENTLIASGFNNSVTSSRSDLYESGETSPAQSAFNLASKPAAFRALGRYSTPFGRKPKIEGESITANFCKKIHFFRQYQIALTDPFSKKHYGCGEVTEVKYSYYESDLKDPC